ncbi:MAG: glycosyltransferase family 4 protein [Candidatus Krumholzibacteriota bacterium]|nr:glycosyltransferase family 4 protein [Candidatus Krumholzibacteriota bacterium]
MMDKKKIRILFFANANTSRMVPQDLNARDITARLGEPFDIYIFNHGEGEVDPKCVKENVTLIDRNGRGGALRALYYIFLKRMDYHFYIRSYQNRSYWWVKRLCLNRAKTVHHVEIILPYPAGEAYRRRARRNALNSDYVFGLTDMIIETVRREFGIAEVGKIPVGVDTEIFRPREVERENDRPRVICVGTLSERKRPLFFVETAARFPGADFLWVGAGKLREEVLQTARKGKVDNFRLLSPLPHPELSREMNRSDILFLPSRHEGLPKVVLEGMACGLPAIAYGDYRPEHVQNGISGYIVASDEEAREKLDLLLADRELRIKLGRAAVERARYFSWDRVARAWSEFLLSGRYPDDFR